MSKGNAFLSLLLALLFAASLSGCGEEEPEVLLETIVTDAASPNYETTTVYRGNFEKTKSGSGTLYYPDVTEVSFGREGAILEELLVASGDTVNAGDAIAVFSVNESTLSLTEKQLNLKEAKENYSYTCTNMEREIASLEQSLLGLSGVDRELKEVEIATAQAEYEKYRTDTQYDIEQLEQEVGALSASFSNLTLYAPCDGIVRSTTFTKPGEEAGTEVIATLYNPDRYLIKVDDSSGVFRYGMEVEIETGSRINPVYYTGTVVSTPALQGGTQSGVLVQVEGGVFASDFSTDITVFGTYQYLEDVLMIDRSAVTTENGVRSVTVLNGDTTGTRYIVTGEMNNEEIVILSGLSEGETVVMGE